MLPNIKITPVCDEITPVGDEENHVVMGNVPVFLLGESQTGYQHRGDESEEGFQCGGSSWINLYQCPGERQGRLGGRQGSRPSGCSGGCGGGYIGGYPERGNPGHNQIQVCVRREMVFCLDTGSDGNIESALECARHSGQCWTPGKEGWIRTDGSSVEVGMRSQETLCYQGAEVEPGTDVVSGEFTRLLGKGVCGSLYGEWMILSVDRALAGITPRMAAMVEPPGREEDGMCAEDLPRGGSDGGTIESGGVPVHSGSERIGNPGGTATVM